MFQGEMAKLTNAVMKGLFYNPIEGLFLKFHFNPNELSITKDTKYDEQELPLYPTSLLFWGNAGGKKIAFDLFFDATDQGYAGISLPRKNLGVLGVEAVLESFLLPAKKRSILSADDLKQYGKNFVSNQVTSIAADIGDAFSSGFSGAALGKLSSKFTEPLESVFKGVAGELGGESNRDSYSVRTPPDIVFVFGRRWFRCKLLSAPFKEQNFNRFLTPRQLTVSVDLYVIEDGFFSTELNNSRKRWADAESNIGRMEYGASLAESSIAFASDILDNNVLTSSNALLEFPMDLSL
jgi:hypothetical protein